uniref:Uncharacterized protein n=1 Tax=Oryza punctata TaxID=4537 RepID=A0A0E0K6N7_ORYPU
MPAEFHLRGRNLLVLAAGRRRRRPPAGTDVAASGNDDDDLTVASSSPGGGASDTTSITQRNAHRPRSGSAAAGEMRYDQMTMCMQRHGAGCGFLFTAREEKQRAL